MNPDHLRKVTEFILAYAKVNQPMGNPINDTKFEKLLMAYDMIKTFVTPAQKKSIDLWLTKMADEEINKAKNKARKTSFNNWNAHRLKIIECIEYSLNNKDFKKYMDIELPIQIEINFFSMVSELILWREMHCCIMYTFWNFSSLWHQCFSKLPKKIITILYLPPEPR